jgi:hypothetical protein
MGGPPCGNRETTCNPFLASRLEAHLPNQSQAVEDGPSATPGTGRVSSELSGGQVPPAASRITVSLIRKAAVDLRAAMERTGLSQTDIVNRALILYQFIDSELEGGAELVLRKDGSDHILKLL